MGTALFFVYRSPPKIYAQTPVDGGRCRKKEKVKEEEKKEILLSSNAIKRQLEGDNGMFCLVLQVSSSGISQKAKNRNAG